LRLSICLCPVHTPRVIMTTSILEITEPSDLQTYLQEIGGPELCTTLTKISGGYTNLTCRSTVRSGITTIIKHAKPISRPNWPVALSANRAKGEQEMLNHIAKELPSVTHKLKKPNGIENGASEGEIVMGTPKGLGYFEQHHVQVIEDFPGTVDFETLLIEKNIDSNTLQDIGEALGVRHHSFSMTAYQNYLIENCTVTREK